MTAIELVLGAPAAGGGFVGRDPSGRVVFVRHGLEGERVLAELTEEHATWARADVLEVLEPSVDRVEPPCAYAGALGCGGCDYQHVELSAQRRIKGQLLAAQLRQVPGVDPDVAVEAAVADGDGLGTRTRVRFAVDEQGRLAMHRHRSHDLVAVATCALGVAPITAAALGDRHFTRGASVEAVSLDATSVPTVTSTTFSPAPRPGAARHRRREVLDGPGLAARQGTDVLGQRFEVSAGVFWQVHARAPELLVTAVLEGLGVAPGDRVLDLYCGAGLFTAAAARAVGPTGAVVGLDSAKAATADAMRNLEPTPWARVETRRVDARAVERLAGFATHAVMDPPRSGADRGALRALSAAPSVQRLVSVSCDPATFARDLTVLVDAGWRVSSIRAIDLFEMTEHLECVAVLER